MPDQSDDVGVTICVPTRGVVRAEWAAALAGLALPINLTRRLQMIPDLSVTEARNAAAQRTLDLGAEYLFFLDDDVLVPNQTLRRFIWQLEQNPEWDLISGIVPVKSNPPEPCVFKDGHPGPYWGWTFNKTFEIDACGMACCLIRTSLFERVSEPWFTWERRHEGANLYEMGEDIGFCLKAKEAGATMMADGGVLCGHIDKKGKTYMLGVDTAPFKRAGNDVLKEFTVLEGEKMAPT